MNENQLTRQQAIEQGYTYCGTPGVEWQNVREITDLEDFEFDLCEWCLFDKSEDCLTVNAEVVKDSILDLVCEAESEIGCDTSMGIDALKEFDWGPLRDLIANVNKALTSATFYTLTTIKLIP